MWKTIVRRYRGTSRISAKTFSKDVSRSCEERFLERIKVNFRTKEISFEDSDGPIEGGGTRTGDGEVGGREYLWIRKKLCRARDLNKNESENEPILSRGSERFPKESYDEREKKGRCAGRLIRDRRLTM